jgi:hypothetical protein
MQLERERERKREREREKERERKREREREREIATSTHAPTRQRRAPFLHVAAADLVLLTDGRAKEMMECGQPKKIHEGQQCREFNSKDSLFRQTKRELTIMNQL